MRTMEAVDVDKNVDKVLRDVEKSREAVLVLKNGRKHCLILPVSPVERELFQGLRRRKAFEQAPR